MNKLTVNGVEHSFENFMQLFDLEPVAQARSNPQYKCLCTQKTKEGVYLLGIETKANEFFMIGALDTPVAEIKVEEE